MEKDIIFSTQRMVPQGIVTGIRYVLFVSPEGYFSLSSQAERTKLERAISSLNAVLKDESFIAVGPGRWGTSTPDLGVHVAYGDIYNVRALVELSGETVGTSPEPSFGTHFFQDLVEAGIYSLPLHLENPDSHFDWDFFQNAANHLGRLSPQDTSLEPYLKVIHVPAEKENRRLRILMDGTKDEAVGFWVTGNWSTDSAISLSTF